MSTVKIKIYRTTRPHEKPAVSRFHSVLGWIRPYEPLPDVPPAESEADGVDYLFEPGRAVPRSR